MLLRQQSSALPNCRSAFLPGTLADVQANVQACTLNQELLQLSKDREAPAQGPVCDEVQGQCEADQRHDTLPVGPLPKRQLLADDFVACTAGTRTWQRFNSMTMVDRG